MNRVRMINAAVLMHLFEFLIRSRNKSHWQEQKAENQRNRWQRREYVRTHADRSENLEWRCMNLSCIESAFRRKPFQSALPRSFSIHLSFCMSCDFYYCLLCNILIDQKKIRIINHLWFFWLIIIRLADNIIVMIIRFFWQLWY